MILTRLKLLCEKANKGEAQLSEELVEEFGELCKTALRKQFTPNEKEFRLRISQIGKSLRQQQCELLGLPKDGEEPYNTVIKFLYGDVAEAIIMTLMKAAGVNIENEQKEVTLNIGGIDLAGTYDVRIGGKIYDIKTASPYAYENKFARGFENVDATDTFGYVTQLYLYAEADKAHVGGWIVLNKVTGELQVVEPPIADNRFKSKHLQLAEANIKRLLATTSINDIDKTIPKVAETYYKKPTGKWVLDSDYTYFPYKQVLWGDKVQHKENKKSSAKIKPKNYYVMEK